MSRPWRLGYARVDGGDESERRLYRVGDWVFLSTLLFLGVTGFILESLRIAITLPSFEVWSPIGWVVGNSFHDLGLSPSAARTMEHGLWWIHGLTALAFVSAIPFTKAAHMITGPTAIAIDDPAAANRLPQTELGLERGYETILDFAREHRLDLDACTKCGKCHEVCPARAGGDPLSPRDLILDLREVSNGSAGDPAAPLVKAGSIKSETLWACTQCMACVDICPVGVQHVPIINMMRRTLVEDGNVDPLLQDTLESIHRTGNSFGEQKRKRARWAKELPFDLPDARKQAVDLLWFVGDYASFDPSATNRPKHCEALKAAGVDFGTLADGRAQRPETTSGASGRRGSSSLAEQNIETISECEFSRIVTSDPTRSTRFSNEYPEPAAHGRAIRWCTTAVLLELIQTERCSSTVTWASRGPTTTPAASVATTASTTRPARSFESSARARRDAPQPRQLVLLRCRRWPNLDARHTRRGTRPSENRIREATGSAAVELFVVACPKDVTMYEDAIKTSGQLRSDQAA